MGGNWIKNSSMQVKDIIKGGKLRPYSELKAETDLMVVNAWRYMQLSLFIEKLPKPIRGEEDYRPFERLCRSDRSGNVISLIYKILSEEGELDVPPYIKKWERELGSHCNLFTVERILKMVHVASADIKRSEINFKCLARWYATPDRLSKLYPDTSDRCWRGCSYLGTMLHICWECPVIKAYWKKIISLIYKITKESLVEDPWICLFHGTKKPFKQYQFSLVPILLDVAKTQIARSWL